MLIFAWERAVQGWIERASARLVTPIRVCNVALAGEEVMTTAAPWLTAAVMVKLWWLGQGRVRAMLSAVAVGVLFAVAFLIARHVEAWAKELAHRGRPRDPNENGLPSGDCAIVTIWALPLLGSWGLLPIAFVMWARIALRAHWPLDTALGVAKGLVLIAPALAVPLVLR